MKHPAYNLRPNKSVDRSLLVARLQELEDVSLLNTSKVAYYGFGGPFLDDFRILASNFPKMSFHSLEKKAHTFRRQKFHKFSPRINLHHRSVDSFLANENMESKEHIVWWLDYTKLGINELKDITSLANCLSPGDVIRVTTCSNPHYNISSLTELLEPGDYAKELKDKSKDFKVEYESYIPDSFQPDSIFDEHLYSLLVVSMIEKALALRSNLSSTRIWQLGSRIYKDGSQMVTCEFYISEKSNAGNKSGLQYLNQCEASRGDPEFINVPNLSIKERLFLESFIPKNNKNIKRLSKSLGYRIENTGPQHIKAIEQYLKYHQHYPILGKVSQ